MMGFPIFATGVRHLSFLVVMCCLFSCGDDSTKGNQVDEIVRIESRGVFYEAVSRLNSDSFSHRDIKSLEDALRGDVPLDQMMKYLILSDLSQSKKLVNSLIH